MLIRSSCTLVSVCTERMVVDFGKANVIEKARQQPDRARQVLEKIKTDGLVPTLQAVHNKRDQSLLLRHSIAGVVAEVGPGVEGFKMWDCMVSTSKYAEIVAAVSLASALGDPITIRLSARSDPFEGIRDSIDFQWSEFHGHIDDFRRIVCWWDSHRRHERYWPKNVELGDR
jgi:hypothetical protein